MNNILIFDNQLDLTTVGNISSLNETERFIKGYRIRMGLTLELGYRLRRLQDTDSWMAYSIEKDTKAERIIIIIHHTDILLTNIPLSHLLKNFR